jgi:predicted GIY-YIG superfamily endonuclease
MKAAVYLVTNLVNGKLYVGKRLALKNRGTPI